MIKICARNHKEHTRTMTSKLPAAHLWLRKIKMKLDKKKKSRLTDKGEAQTYPFNPKTKIGTKAFGQINSSSLYQEKEKTVENTHKLE